METECAEMVPRRARHRLAGSSDSANSGIATAPDVEVVELKRRIATMVRLIADFDRLAANLDQEVWPAPGLDDTRLS